MPEPLTPTPLSEAVARLKLFVAPEPSLRARVISMSLLQSDVALLLDAVAEGREDTKRLDFLSSDNNASLGSTFHKATRDFGTLVQVNGSRAWGFTMREAIDAAIADAQSPSSAPAEPGATVSQSVRQSVSQRAR